MEAISGSRPSGNYKIPARIEKKNNVIYISFIQTRVYLCKKETVVEHQLRMLVEDVSSKK